MTDEEKAAAEKAEAEAKAAASAAASELAKKRHADEADAKKTRTPTMADLADLEAGIRRDLGAAAKPSEPSKKGGGLVSTVAVVVVVALVIVAAVAAYVLKPFAPKGA